MKAKWYISTFIIVLAFFGFNQEQELTPNQQIVLQFVDNHVRSNEKENTIAFVTKQLQSFGINDVKVEQHEQGIIKIAYYSNTDVASIKKVLSTNKNSGYVPYKKEIESEKYPFNKKENNFNLDIYEIHADNDVTSDLKGKYIFELKQEYDRFSNPNLYTYLPENIINYKNNIVKIAYKINKNVAITIDHSSYKIPEVRAGPSA